MPNSDSRCQSIPSVYRDALRLRGRGRWEEVTRARPGDPHCESCLEPQLHSSNVTFFWRFGSIYRLNG